jgi:multiple sugar transport system substrate-binding protein
VECQSVVASYGVVFPAIKGQAERAIEVQKGKGVDSSAFLTMAKSKTFLAPIADGGSEIDAVMKSALESVLVGRSNASNALKAANAKVNQLAKK